MKQKLPGLLLVAVVVLMAACSRKGPVYTQYIPKDASYVVSLDVKSMMTKLEKDSLPVENMLEVLRDSTNPSRYSKALDMWKQFKDAGLDLDNKVFLAVPSFDMNAGNVNFQVLAGLKDEKKLEAFVAKMPNAPKVTKDGDISYATQDEMVVGWNKDAVMILGGHNTPRIGNDYPTDSTTVNPGPAPVPGGGTGMVDKMKKYFALKKDESIVSVSSFTDVTAEKGDIMIFTNSGGLAGSQANPALAMMPKVKELLADIYSTTTIDFEEGKMVVNSKTFVGPKLADILKKYAGPEVDMSLVDPYPSNNVNGVVAFSFNPELIPALLKETGFDALADIGLAQQGITTADIIKAFKGDFAVIFSDFTMSKLEKKNLNDENYISTEPSAKLLVAVRINDKASFEKLISIGLKNKMIIRQGNRLLPARDGEADTSSKIFIGVENNLLVFSNDDAVYKAYAAKTGKIGLSDEAKASIKGSSFAVFIDAEKILNSIPETVFDSTSVHEKNIFAKSKTVFKTFDFTTSNFDGKKIDGKGEVIMATSKNSLPQLVRFLMYTAEEMKLRNAEQEVKWHNDDGTPDSTAIRPVH